MANPVVIFDGVCNLCNSSVDFIIRRDRDEVFRFASNQSDIGQELVSGAGLDSFDGETIVLVEDGKATMRSTALLHIVRRLGYPWKLAYGFVIVPAFIRDALYGVVVKNRYRMFGKRDTCRIPTEAERARLLG